MYSSAVSAAVATNSLFTRASTEFYPVEGSSIPAYSYTYRWTLNIHELIAVESMRWNVMRFELNSKPVDKSCVWWESIALLIGLCGIFSFIWRGFVATQKLAGTTAKQKDLKKKWRSAGQALSMSIVLQMKCRGCTPWRILSHHVIVTIFVDGTVITYVMIHM